MKANTIYKKLNNPETNYFGPNSTRIDLLAESDMSRFGAFALQFTSMVQFPVKSYGKAKKSYTIEVWELRECGPCLITELHFKTKAECLKRFKQGDLV